MKKSSVTMNVIYNMLFQIFTTCLPVITTPYLSRTLGLYQSGVYSFVDSIVTLLFLELLVPVYMVVVKLLMCGMIKKNYLLRHTK